MRNYIRRELILSTTLFSEYLAILIPIPKCIILQSMPLHIHRDNFLNTKPRHTYTTPDSTYL